MATISPMPLPSTSTRSPILKSAPTRLEKALAVTLAGRRAASASRLATIA